MRSSLHHFAADFKAHRRIELQCEPACAVESQSNGLLLPTNQRQGLCHTCGDFRIAVCDSDLTAQLHIPSEYSVRLGWATCRDEIDCLW